MNRKLGRWVLPALVVIVIGVGGGYAYSVYSKPLVTITTIVEGPVVHAFYSTGTIEPVREYAIKSNLAGVLTEVLVDKGDKVKKGDRLAVVSDPNLLYQVNKTQAELTEKLARADEKASPVLLELEARLQADNEMLDIAKRDQDRLAELLKKNAASQTDLDRSMDRLKTMWSEVESIKAQKQAKRLELQREVAVARAALQTAQWNLDQQTLKSPIDGVVLDRPVSLGTRLAINDHIMQVADVRPANLVMRGAVDEEDKTAVFLGQTVRLTLYAFAERIFAGKVTRIYDKADADRRTFEIDVSFTDPNPGFSPGMTGELAFIIAEKDRALVAPAQTLQSGRIYVLRGGKTENADVKIGLKSVERIEIVSGLSAGDQVVISPLAGIAPGTSVRARWMDPSQAAGLNKPAKEEEAFKGFSK